MPRHIKHELDDAITARIILENVQKSGGELALQVRWARMILEKEKEKNETDA
jgi:hypothetical protein